MKTKPSQTEIAVKYFDDSIEKLTQDSTCEVNEPLVHYTSVEGFKGIVNSRKFRMTDYVYLCDKEEIKYAKGLIEAAAEPWIKKNSFRYGFLEFLWSLFYKTNHYGEFLVCTTSFCTQLDDVDMFKRFADHGRGVGLIFKKEYFNPKNKDELPADSEYVVTTNILYNKTYIENLLREIFECAHRLSEKIPMGRSQLRHKKIVFPKLLTHLLSLMPAIKEEKYKEENEHRLYQCQLKYEGVINPERQKELVLKKRPRKGNSLH